MNCMDLVNKKVTHKTFGKGIICEGNDNIITVDFGNCVKKFIFPDAFNDHLEPTDKKSRQYVRDILDKLNEEIHRKRQEELDEAQRKQWLQNLPVNLKSQAAFRGVENDLQKVMDSRNIFSGKYLSGYNRGEPRIPSRVFPNSACLLTYCDKNSPEECRVITGIFMTKDDFVGSECRDGYIPTHEKYFITLNENERENLKFWSYFPKETEGKPAKWGSVEIKYFANNIMAHILSDIITLKRGTGDEQLCEEFLDYFCKLNKINKHSLTDLNKEKVS